MDYTLLYLSARIRAFCVVLALFLLPGAVHADDVYLLTSQTINGTEGNYNVPSNHQFTNTSGTVYTYTINQIPTGGTFSFRIGMKDWDKDILSYLCSHRKLKANNGYERPKLDKKNTKL